MPAEPSPPAPALASAAGGAYNIDATSKSDCEAPADCAPLIEHEDSVRAEHLSCGDDAHGAACFPSGGMVAAVYILCSPSLGVGVFALPAALKLTGVALGCALLAGFAAAGAHAQLLALSAARQLGATSYEELARGALGRVGHVYLAAAMTATCFIGNCAHIQTVTQMLGDMLIWFVDDTPSVTADWHLAQRKRTILTAILLAVAFPYTLQRTLGSLRFVSTASVSAVMATSLAFSLYCYALVARGDYAGHSPRAGAGAALRAVSTTPQDFFRAAGACCYAFSSILTLFPVRREMRAPQGVGKAVWASTAVTLAIYLLAGTAGAVAFGTATADNCIYNTLPKDHDYFRPLWFVLVVCIVLLYPVINYPLVCAVESVAFGAGPPPRHSRAAISAAGVVGTLIVCAAVPDLVDLFGLCGALGLGSVSYVIPCAAFLRVDPRPWHSASHVAAVVTLSAGTTVTAASTFFVLQHIAQR